MESLTSVRWSERAGISAPQAVAVARRLTLFSMKYLPCDTCKETALATRSGLLHCAGTLHDPVVRYKCVRCGTVTTLTSAQFAVLPRMTDEEIDAETCDVTRPVDPPA